MSFNKYKDGREEGWYFFLAVMATLYYPTLFLFWVEFRGYGPAEIGQSVGLTAASIAFVVAAFVLAMVSWDYTRANVTPSMFIPLMAWIPMAIQHFVGVIFLFLVLGASRGRWGKIRNSHQTAIALVEFGAVTGTVQLYNVEAIGAWSCLSTIIGVVLLIYIWRCHHFQNCIAVRPTPS